MRSGRFTVLIADDEEAFRKDFLAKHGGSTIKIEQLNDVYSLPEHLASVKRLPDLVVVDLYRTKAQPDSEEADQGNAQVDTLLAKLEAVSKELKSVVDRVKTPAAIAVLREIREIPRLAEIPVLIYTRQGLSLLSDDEIRDATHLGAEWMLKGRSASLERAQMTAFLRKAQMRRKRLKRDVMLTIIGALAGAALGWFTQVIQ